MYSRLDFLHNPKILNSAFLIIILLFFSTSPACAKERNFISEKLVTGFVRQVEQESIDTFSSLIIIDHDGVLWEFGKGTFPDFNPSHLLQHKIMAEPITITFVKEKNGTLKVLKIRDADH